MSWKALSGMERSDSQQPCCADDSCSFVSFCSYEMQELLRAAARQGHGAELSRLLKQDVDLNSLDGGSWNAGTVLHEAAAAGQLESARLLLRHGALASARAHSGFAGCPLPGGELAWNWSRFVHGWLCGPKPRAFARGSRMRALLLRHELRECSRCVCGAPRPRPPLCSCSATKGPCSCGEDVRVGPTCCCACCAASTCFCVTCCHCLPCVALVRECRCPWPWDMCRV